MSSKTSLSHNPVNSIGHQALSFKQRNFIVVWFDDPTLSITNNAQRTIADLEHIVGTLTLLDDADKCVEYVNNVKDHQVLLIVGESIGAQVVRRVLQASKLKSVYIRCLNQSIHPPWVDGCQSVKCIFVDSSSICERIEIDTEDNSIDFNVSDSSSISLTTAKNHNKQDVKFMYSQLFMYTLTEMTYSSDDIDNLIRFFEDKCKNQTKDIEKMKKFKDNYGNESPVWCYSNYAFIYKTLNSALRTCDADAICTMGVFIKSLHQQIVELHKTMPRSEILKLYRGLVIPLSHFEEIKKKKGGLLSFNSFLSTSLNENVAHMFSDNPPSDQTAVLFEITVNRSMSTNVAYANIQALSQYTDEQEFLFTIGSAFRIESVEQLDGDRKWCVHLTLTTDHDPKLAQVTSYMRSHLLQPDLSSLTLLLLQMGEFKKGIDIGEAAIKACKNISILSILYQMLGHAYTTMGDYQSALTNLELSLEYSSQLSTGEETSCGTHMTKGLISLIKGELDLALSNFQAAKQNSHECPGDKDQDEILSTYNMLISIVLQRQGNFVDALEYQTRAYDMAKKCLPPTHPAISECLDQLSLTYMIEERLDEALLCMEQSVRIQEDSLPPEHISVVQSQAIHELLRYRKGDRSISEYPTPSLSTSLLKWQADSQENPVKLLYLARMHLLHDKIDESLSILNQYFNIQKENFLFEHCDLAVAYFYRGICCKKKANLSEALEDLEKGRKIATQHLAETHPVRILVSLSIAEIHAELGNCDEALIMVDQCKSLTPKVSEFMAKSYDSYPLKSIAFIFKRQGLEHLEKKDYKKALSRFQSCLNIQMNFLSSEHPDVGETYKYIAQVYNDMGNYSDALANYKKAQDIFEKYLVPNDPEIAGIWKKLRFIYVELKQYDNALLACDKYLQIQKNTLPLDHLDFAETYTSIGNALFFQQKFSDAFISHRKALDIQLKHLPENDPKFVHTYTMLGLLYFEMKQYSDGLFAFEKVLEIQSTTLPSGSIGFAETHQIIACACCDTLQHEKALRHFQKCLDIHMSSPSPNNLDLVDTLSRIGEVYRRQNNPSDALVQDQFALDILLRYVSSKDVILAKKWVALGTDYRMLHDYQQALTAFNQSLEILSNSLPSEYLDVAFIHKEMGLIFNDTEQHEKALSCFQKCFSVRQSVLPPEHLYLAEIQSFIGDTSYKLNNLSDALMNYQCALDIQLKHLPESCFETIKTWENLGQVYYGLRQYNDSLSAFNECLEYQLNILPSDHINISVTLKRIACVYYIVEKYEEALTSFRECLIIQKSSLSPKHPAIADTESWICKASSELSNVLNTSSIQRQAL